MGHVVEWCEATSPGHAQCGRSGFLVPDSRTVAFTSCPWTGLEDCGPEFVWLTKVGGGGKRRLAQGSDPAWYPDGRQIAFAGAGRKNSDLYLINVDGTKLRRLTRTAAHEGSPTWSPDGAWIAFARVGTPHADVSVPEPAVALAYGCTRR